jgi:Transposase DDE domain group 1
VVVSRHRTDIEALNKDAQHGVALRHLPSGDLTVNTVWMWAALLATALSAWLQELTGIDRGNGRGRRTIVRLRRELVCVPARVVHHARRVELRLPPGPQLLTLFWSGCGRYLVPVEDVTARSSIRPASTPGTCGIPAHPVRQPGVFGVLYEKQHPQP